MQFLCHMNNPGTKKARKSRCVSRNGGTRKRGLRPLFLEDLEALACLPFLVGQPAR